jgi:hypothetical protein
MKKMKELNFYEMLSYSTTRIECELADGKKSVGTGFFIYLNDIKNKKEEHRVALITNKHVIKDAVEGQLILTEEKDGVIQNTKHFRFPHSSFESAWIPHPDQKIDLCMLNLKPYELLFEGSGKELFYFPLPLGLIPMGSEIDSIDTLEDVIMIGYPNGIWDSYNNKPIFRKGITATDYRLNYDNRPEFLIDMAVFPGSSGSPVLMVRISRDKEEKFHREIYLLGILSAGFQNTIDGKIKIVEIPQNKQAFVETQMPNNLGIVIKAEKLFDFRNIFYP